MFKVLIGFVLFAGALVGIAILALYLFFLAMQKAGDVIYGKK